MLADLGRENGKYNRFGIEGECVDREIMANTEGFFYGMPAFPEVPVMQDKAHYQIHNKINLFS
jgi:hypothetical protein